MTKPSGAAAVPGGTEAAPSLLVLTAPLSGRLVSLEQVPDPVFAQKMVGDGVSLDPVTQSLVAPCDGVVAQIHSAGHAVTIATNDGTEVLMHVGIDTVLLGGRGFTARVKAGDRVARGAVLVDFDADFVATHAKSLLTQIVVTSMGRVRELHAREGDVTAGTDTILEVALAPASAESGGTGGASVSSDAITIPNPAGLHARPAAVLANAAKRFAADVRLRRGGREANAKSVVSILGMEVCSGDRVVLAARGADASEAIRILAPMLVGGLGEDGDAVPAAAPAAARRAPPPPPPARAPGEEGLFAGVAASPGLAVGEVLQVRRRELLVEETASDPREEVKRLDAAVAESRLQLEALQTKLRERADSAEAAIFGAHEELLGDPELRALAERALATGKSAAFAWREAVEAHASVLEAAQSELLRARAADLRDVGRRVLECLAGGRDGAMPDVPPNSILIAEDLSPSETAGLDRSRVLGFCTTLGGSTSHVAILARSLDIPAVAGVDPRALALPDGSPVVLDGGRGTLRLAPDAGEVARVRARQQRHAERRAADMARALEPALTRDGHRVEVVANVGGADDATEAVRVGGEGVGLLRSEFLFLDRTEAPTEDEQYEAYVAVAEAFGPDRPLIIRTLDVGGDKPLPYLPIPAEANPFLGERGIRVGLNRPELLRAQLRAILRASRRGRVLVMFPMIATLPELREARRVLEEARADVGADPIPVGIMVEVPAAALMAPQFAREVDFFSVGSNDLTQYTLAMDRGHPKLAPFVDGLNPAVLRLVDMTVRAARAEGKWVGVCGGIGSDAQAVPLLVGLGVSELSVSVPAIPAVKAQIRALDLAECRRLAERALDLETAADVRALVPDPEDA